MEVGAVKQAFNNEVILLKKNLNQAKIHVIHKLTRKAKTITEKKPPEHLKEKLKRKAESAVNEVLILKKIKARDIAKFIITHTGEVKDFLNTPRVDNDKACARLVLHKALQDKYTFIRNRFGNVPIKDLFMSRQERRKIKKEAREQQKNKNKKKGKEGKVVNAAGDWDVEDVHMGDESKDISQNEINSDDEGIKNDESEHSGAEMNERSDEENDSEVENEDDIENSVDENHNSQSDDDKSDDEINDNDETEDDDDHGNDDKEEFGKNIKLNPVNENEKAELPKPPKTQKVAKIDKPEIGSCKPQKKQMDKKVKENTEANKKVKENKNKNLKEKLQNRKFKKDEDVQVEGRKVVDPFFITATGENYLSLAEPRQPDEVKEIHKRGNRKERRAAEFGHEVKRPRRDNFRQNNFRSNKFDRQDGNDESPSGGFRNNNDRFNRGPSFNDRNTKYNDRDNKFNDRNGKFNDRSTNYNDRNSNFDDSSKFNDDNSKFNNRNSNNSRNEKKDEKLHPSWEAKKKLKSAMSLLPAQGKKIVFN